MFLFDTDVVSLLMKGDPPRELIRRLAHCPPETQHTTVITVGELFYGAYRSQRGAELFPKIEQVLRNLSILSFNRSAAKVYGSVRAKLEAAGTPLATADLQIAAIALARGLTLVTGNIGHFSRVPGLTVEDWF